MLINSSLIYPSLAYNMAVYNSTSKFSAKMSKESDTKNMTNFDKKKEKQKAFWNGGGDTSNDISSTQVRVVTFDLDNTLWKTKETIDAANDALNTYLSTKNNNDGNPIMITKRIEKVMGDLFRADRRKYCPGAAAMNKNFTDEELEQSYKSPVSLTQLRIDAICRRFGWRWILTC